MGMSPAEGASTSAAMTAVEAAAVGVVKYATAIPATTLEGISTLELFPATTAAAVVVVVAKVVVVVVAVARRRGILAETAEAASVRPKVARRASHSTLLLSYFTVRELYPWR